MASSTFTATPRVGLQEATPAELTRGAYSGERPNTYQPCEGSALRSGARELTQQVNKEALYGEPPNRNARGERP
jgi:hypothetical protein